MSLPGAVPPFQFLGHLSGLRLLARPWRAEWEMPELCPLPSAPCPHSCSLPPSPAMASHAAPTGHTQLSTLCLAPVGRLTSGGDHADNDGCRGAGALYQHCHQDAHHQPRHWVGQDGVVLEDVASHLPWKA